MRGLFVTGTDTGAGKTLVSAAMLRALLDAGHRVAPMKPVASGAHPSASGLRNEDAELLIGAAGGGWPYEQVNPFAYEPAIAPHLAAAEAARPIEFAVIHQQLASLGSAAEAVIVEGVGGWQVPLTESETLADLARSLALPVVLVVGLRLGCLNHALLSRDAIAASGLRLVAWAGSVLDPAMVRLDENVAALRQRLALPCLGVLPRLHTGDLVSQAVRHLDRTLLEHLLFGPQ